MKDTFVADGQVRLIVKHFPLPSHPGAAPAAEAAECAALQGKFWEMKSLLFERNDEWGSATDLPGAFAGYAGELGLDVETFQRCLDSGEAQLRWQQDQALGQAVGVRGTPNFFIIRRADLAYMPIGGYIDAVQWQQAIEQIVNAPPRQ